MTNDGTSVGIGTPTTNDSRLIVRSLTSDAIAGRSTIEVVRAGLIAQPGTLVGCGVNQPEAALRATSTWGNSYTAAVFGTTYLDYVNTAGVLGANNSGSIFGALAYVAPDGTDKAGYFNGDVEITETLLVEKIVVPNPVFSLDKIGLDLRGIFHYIRMDDWLIGSTGNNLTIGTDIKQATFRFSSSEFSPFPAFDNVLTLGTLSARWTTVYASNGTINTSDAREKKNIQELDYGLETLMQLKPVSYEWKEDVSNMGTKLGFVAQDLLEVVPEVVVTKEAVKNRETGEVTYQEAERMGVFYDDLIPVLTKAIQEQQGTIEEVASENAELRKENDDLRVDVEELKGAMQRFEQDLQTCCFSSQSEVGANDSSSENAELGQNIPNPFSESTIIRYYLPDGTNSAIIRVTDMSGSPVKDLQLGATRGANQVEFQTQGLAAGTYLYSLFVDGKFVDTKKMMIAR